MKRYTIQELTESYPQLEGAKILSLLIRHPNRPIMSTVMELALSTELNVDEAENQVYHPAAIAMTDQRTLREVDLRLLRLQELKAMYLADLDKEISPDHSNPYDTEIKQLMKYRKECTRPNGTPKSFQDEYRRAYRRQYAAIRRLLAKAEADGHDEAVAIVKRSLRLGRMCCLYSEAEIDSQRDSPSACVRNPVNFMCTLR